MSNPFERVRVARLSLDIAPGPVSLQLTADALGSARAMAIAYQVGDVMRTLDAVDEVKRRFFDGSLDIDRRRFQDLVFGWESVGQKLNGVQRAGLMARVFGVDDPRRSKRDEVNSTGQKVMSSLLKSLGALPDAICRCNGNPPLGVFLPVDVAGRTVRAHLAGVITGAMTMQAREWAGQVNLAVEILNALGPAALGGGRRPVLEAIPPNHWPTVAALLPDASPADLVEGQAKVDAWNTLFDWLGTADLSLADPVVLAAVVDAAMVLTGSWHQHAPTKSCC